MGIAVCIALIVLFLYIWGNGPRKTTAQTIVKAEDVKDRAVQIAKATPGALETARDTTATAAAKVVTTSTAAGKVIGERAVQVGGVAKVKGGEFVSEAKTYTKGFVSDVKRQRSQIKAERKRLSRADRVAKSKKDRKVQSEDEALTHTVNS